MKLSISDAQPNQFRLANRSQVDCVGYSKDEHVLFTIVVPQIGIKQKISEGIRSFISVPKDTNISGTKVLLNAVIFSFVDFDVTCEPVSATPLVTFRNTARHRYNHGLPHYLTQHERTQPPIVGLHAC